MLRNERYPRSLLDVAAMHSFYNGLGYLLKEEVFVIFNNGTVLIELRAEGLSLILRMSEAELGPEVMREKWFELLQEWNTGGSLSKEDKDRVYKESKVCGNEEKLIALLIRHGFKRFLSQNGPKNRRDE